MTDCLYTQPHLHRTPTVLPFILKRSYPVQQPWHCVDEEGQQTAEAKWTEHTALRKRAVETSEDFIADALEAAFAARSHLY
jgi:hypothetical protein